jgi:glycosyltransferase involved in cell wall biosynthesis
MYDWLSSTADLSIQVIIVHDKGRDRTASELRDIVSDLDSENIILIEGEYGSPGLARNAGLALASSKWVTFWDSDDSPEVSKYLALVNLAEKHSCTMAAAGFRVIDDKTKRTIRTFSYSSNHASNLITTAINPGIWRMIFSANLVENIKFLNIRVAEDQYFIAQCLTKNPVIYFEEAFVYNYYINPDFQNSRKKDNLRDLATSLKLVSNLEEKGNTRLNEFLEVLLIRQSLTYIKNFRNFASVVIAIKLMKNFLKLSMNRKFQIIKNINNEKLLKT